MIVKYLAFHMELQKRGMATIRSGQTQILLFSQQKFLSGTPSCLSSNISAYASMKKTKHFVYVQ